MISVVAGGFVALFPLRCCGQLRKDDLSALLHDIFLRMMDIFVFTLFWGVSSFQIIEIEISRQLVQRFCFIYSVGYASAGCSASHSH